MPYPASANPIPQGFTAPEGYDEYPAVMALLMSPKYDMTPEQARLYAAKILQFRTKDPNIIDEAVQADIAKNSAAQAAATDKHLSEMQQYARFMTGLATMKPTSPAKPADPAKGVPKGKR